MPDVLASSGHPVKLYISNDTNSWDEKGQGHVHCELDETTNTYVLKVISSNTAQLSLCSPIRPQRASNYHLQGNTIISWTEQEFFGNSSVDVALFFAQPEACRDIWQRISQLIKINPSSSSNDLTDRNSNSLLDSTLPSSPIFSQRNVQNSVSDPHHTFNPSNTLSNDNNTENTIRQQNPISSTPTLDSPLPDAVHSTRFLEENLDHTTVWNTDPIEDVIFTDNNIMFLGQAATPFLSTACPETTPTPNFVMPEPNRDGVETLSRILSDQTMLHIPAIREHIIEFISGGEYVSKLCQLFRKAELSTDIDCLEMLYHIMRCFFSIGTNNVLEVLLNDKHLNDVVGCLEYDPDKIPELRRRILESKTAKKQIPSSTSPENCSNHVPNGLKQLSDDSSKERELRNEEGNFQEMNNKSHDKEDPSKPKASDKNSLYSQGNEPISKVLSNRTLPNSVNGANSPSKCPDQPSQPSEANLEKDDRSTNSRSPKKKCAQLEEGPTAENMSRLPDKEFKIQSQMETKQCNDEPTIFSGNNVDGFNSSSFVIKTHREFLQRKALFKSVVSITDPNVLGKIHQNYRVVYIRDVILSPVYDDNASNALSALILYNSVDIIMYFISGSTKLQDLFHRLKNVVQHRQECSNSNLISTDKQIDTNDNLNGEEVKNKKAPAAMEASAAYATDHNMEKYEKIKRDSPDILDNLRDADSATAANTCPSETRATGATDESTAVASKDSTHPADVLENTPDESGPDGSTANKRKCPDHAEALHRDLLNLLGFLRELCGMVRMQQPPLKNRFHSLLLDLGVLDIAVDLLRDEDSELRSLCCDILYSTITHNQGHVRYHILKSGVHQDSSNVISHPEDHGSNPVLFDTVKHVATNMTGVGVTAEVISGGNVSSRPVCERRELSPHEQDDKPSSPSSADETRCENQQGKMTSKSCRKPRQNASTKSEDSSQMKICSYDMDSNYSSDINQKRNAVETTTESQRCEKRPRTSTVLMPDVTDKATPDLNKGYLDEDQELSRQARSTSEFPLLRAMVDVICDEEENTIAPTVLDLMRTLLDPNTMLVPTDKKAFMEVFYKYFAPLLLRPIRRIMEGHGESSAKTTTEISYDSVCHVCDLLSFCVANNSYHSRYFVLAFNVGGMIANLLTHERAHVRLSALRFIRACVGNGEEGYDRYITRRNLLDPVMDLYHRNGNRDNLTSSAILELIDRVRKTPRIILMKHIMEKHAAVLEPSSKHCTVFAHFKAAYEEEKRRNSVINTDKTNIASITNPSEIGAVPRTNRMAPIVHPGDINHEKQIRHHDTHQDVNGAMNIAGQPVHHMNSQEQPVRFSEIRDTLLKENEVNSTSFSEDHLTKLQSFDEDPRRLDGHNTSDVNDHSDKRSDYLGALRYLHKQKMSKVDTFTPTVEEVENTEAKDKQIERRKTNSRDRTLSKENFPLEKKNSVEYVSGVKGTSENGVRSSGKSNSEALFCRFPVKTECNTSRREESNVGNERSDSSRIVGMNVPNSKSMQECEIGKNRELNTTVRKPVRFTFSKSAVQTGELNETIRSILERNDTGDWKEDSSDSEVIPRKRERKFQIQGGVEICTTSISDRSKFDSCGDSNSITHSPTVEMTTQQSTSVMKNKDIAEDGNEQVICSSSGISKHGQHEVVQIRKDTSNSSEHESGSPSRRGSPNKRRRLQNERGRCNKQ